MNMEVQDILKEITECITSVAFFPESVFMIIEINHNDTRINHYPRISKQNSKDTICTLSHFASLIENFDEGEDSHESLAIICNNEVLLDIDTTQINFEEEN